MRERRLAPMLLACRDSALATVPPRLRHQRCQWQKSRLPGIGQERHQWPKATHYVDALWKEPLAFDHGVKMQRPAAGHRALLPTQMLACKPYPTTLQVQYSNVNPRSGNLCTNHVLMIDFGKLEVAVPVVQGAIVSACKLTAPYDYRV